jgi:prolyl-tRNA synthetase
MPRRRYCLLLQKAAAHKQTSTTNPRGEMEDDDFFNLRTPSELVGLPSGTPAHETNFVPAGLNSHPDSRAPETNPIKSPFGSKAQAKHLLPFLLSSSFPLPPPPSAGVMIMVHGDNQGLVLPPRIAPIQVPPSLFLFAF